METTLFTYLGYLGYGLLLAAFALKDLPKLRMLAMAGSACLALAAGLTGTNWPLCFANVAFFAANGIHLALLRRQPTAASLDPLETFLSKTALMNFPPAEIRSFLARAKEGELDKGRPLVKAGTELGYLFLVVSGGVSVIIEQQKITDLNAGCWVGEMSLLTKSQTRADVVTHSPSKFLVWAHSDIDEWINGDPVRLAHLQTALGAQVVEQLLRQNEAMRHTRNVAV